jgi:hypothetical protein
METAEDSAVADFLQILEEHRKNCERQVRRPEAQLVLLDPSAARVPEASSVAHLRGV